MNHVLVSLASPFYIYIYIYILSVHAKLCTCIMFTLYINNTQLYIIIMQGSKLKLQLIQSGNATNFFGLATKEFMFVARSVDLFQEFSEVGVALIKLSVHFSNQAQKHSCRVGVFSPPSFTELCRNEQIHNHTKFKANTVESSSCKLLKP